VVSHYFLPRWNLFLNAVNSSLVTGVPFNQTHTTQRIFTEVEELFVHDTTAFPTSPQGNILTLIQETSSLNLAQNIGCPDFSSLSSCIIFSDCNVYVNFAGDSIAIAMDIHARWRSHFVVQRSQRRFQHRRKSSLSVSPSQSHVFSFTAEVS
jgi:hypothetical protein